MTEVNFGRSRLACHPHPCFCFPNSPAFGQIWSNLAPNLRRLARVGPHLAGFARASLLGRVASNRSAASGHACATGFVGFLVGPKRVGMLPMFSFASARLPGPCWASPQVRREARGGGCGGNDARLNTSSARAIPAGLRSAFLVHQLCPMCPRLIQPRHYNRNLLAFPGQVDAGAAQVAEQAEPPNLLWTPEIMFEGSFW